ncbi:aminopeptidase N [Pseudidiomarina gelatinasegens]|uniref:aminopeptidase N n=1 Tax=Pseudidiomarina gelatinasegens TaxID=2487740 RepID=UPI0030EBC507
MTAQLAKLRSDYKAPEFRITSVDLTVYLHDTRTHVTNRMQIEPLAACTALRLHGEHMTLQSVKINGQSLTEQDYQITDKALTLNSVPNKAFELTIVNTINPAANTALEGLYKSGGAFCTQCEAEGFRRITYYLDRPDILAVFTTTITADKQTYPYLLSNGNAVAQGDNSDGTHWVRWHDPHPKPAYLFALVAGNFEVLTDHYTTKSGREVLLQLFVDQGNLKRADYAMAALKNSMRWDEERFGLEYDLDIYMIVAVDFFNMGAMENKGLNVFNSRYVLADSKTATDQDFLNVESVIGHEYFHNWTGNRITCRDWFQLSLKEGLTVFRDQEFSSDLGSRAVNRIDAIRIIRTHQFNEDASPMAHPIRPDKVIEMNNFYTVTVYNKGAEVIRMLHTLLGEKGFQAGMKLYVQRHDGQAVTCDDFVAAMADANDTDLGLFQRWYSQAGTPTVKVSQRYDAKAKALTLAFAQETPPTPGQAEKSAVHIPVLLSAYTTNGQLMAMQHPQLRRHESGSLLFELTKHADQLTIENVEEAPVLALLENFSAPVKLEFDQDFSDSIVLLANAQQDVTRWEAAQHIYTKLILDAVSNQNPLELPLPVAKALQNMAATPLDAALKSLVVTPPTVEEIAEYFTRNIPLAAIDDAVNSLRQQIANCLHNEFAAIWAKRKQEPYQLSGSAIANRSLQHTALYYLALNKPAQFSAEVARYFSKADNMTAQQSALQIAVHLNLDCKQQLLDAFEQQWQNDPLVLDKWFAIQAGAPHANVAETVATLKKHSRFNPDNPNRQYALYATFGRNMVQFHRADGAGYRLMADMISYLNTKNPQVAARLVTPLTQWRRYDEQRRQQMKAVLEALHKLPDLASDLDEKISQSLATD